jgi:hypothetical protein
MRIRDPLLKYLVHGFINTLKHDPHIESLCCLCTESNPNIDPEASGRNKSE